MYIYTLKITLWGLSLVLGFLLVYRSQSAYGRFWDGASYLEKVRAGWFNAASSCFAFSTEKKDSIEHIYVDEYTCINIYIYMQYVIYICIYIQKYLCIYTYIYVYIYTCVYIYRCIHVMFRPVILIIG